MDTGVIGSVASTIGGVLTPVGVVEFASTEKERTDVTGEVGEYAGPGLAIVYAGLAVIGIGIVVMPAG